MTEATVEKKKRGGLTWKIVWLFVAFIGGNILWAWFTGDIIGNYHAYYTPSSSMESALFSGDRLIADQSAYDTEAPARGDVVVFIYPIDGTTQYISRCVAVPGDTVEIIDKILLINGEPASEPATVKYIDTTETGEPRIRPRARGALDSRDNFGPIVVPEARFFMLGDSRDNSADSRFWGFVPGELIVGKALFIHYSSDWGRIGMRVE